MLRERLLSLSLEQKVRLLTGADFWSLHPEPAIGLRRLVLSDGPAGVRGELWDERDPSANIPSPTALAASWDEARVERLGRLLAAEARRKGVDVLLAPTVNLHRSPYGGRHFECFSEDPLLTARIGVAYVRGVQAGGVAATVKHFVANDSETERFSLDARVDERALRERYLAPFEPIVGEAGVWAVMAAYNSINGVTATEHPMLREVLKDEWGFDGVVMSDWYAARSTEPAARAGLDLVMPGPSGPWGDRLVAAVRDGRVPEAVIDDKVLRLLRLAARVGALEGIDPAAAPDPWPDDAVAAELRESAAAGFVLVRNAQVDAAPALPLDRSALRRVAVLGPNAEVARTLGGGSATVFPRYTVSVVEGLRAALGAGVQVDHGRGVRSTDRLPVAPMALLRRPDGGGAGVEVRFLAADGTVRGREDRTTGAFNWLSRFGPDLPIAEVAAVEVQTRLRAPESGTYLLGGSGLGQLWLTIAGQVAFDTVTELPAGADPVEALMRPPQRSVALELRAGEEVPVVLRYRPRDTGGFGEAELDAVTFQLNLARRASDEEELQQAVALAAEADVAVVVVGTTEEVESEGFDRDSLALPGRQDELVRRVAAVNPRTVVVVNAGAPVLLPWIDEVAAVLVAWFPGQEFGNALADVLLGDREPGGRLPMVWPAAEHGHLPSTRPVDGRLVYEESIHVGNCAYDRAGTRPAFPFGHGLGYTTWDHLDVTAPPRLDPDGNAVVTVRVRNTGSRPGREVVQVYASRPASAVERPTRWLAGFATVDADPGQEATADIVIPARALAHWDDESHAWTIEQGIFHLAVGGSYADQRLVTEIAAAMQDR
ncbi:MAG TPA: glycoside hydrolase family 3 C-terminal domain-containing protein [Actinomycetota bacterium]|nr:glycoside hydrolase family 3 C-terminal domain-containing protein [Actinomycetota bacterium]